MHIISLPTVIVVLIVGVLLMLGAVLLGGAKRGRKSRPRDKYTCEQCDHPNPRNAKYCARCGRELNVNE